MSNERSLLSLPSKHCRLPEYETAMLSIFAKTQTGQILWSIVNGANQWDKALSGWNGVDVCIIISGCQRLLSKDIVAIWTKTTKNPNHVSTENKMIFYYLFFIDLWRHLIKLLVSTYNLQCCPTSKITMWRLLPLTRANCQYWIVQRNCCAIIWWLLGC